VTEQQPYDVVDELGDVEVRHYPEHLVAETEVSGPFERAGNRAFGRLTRYIGGRNDAGRTVAMTAPVVQEEPDADRFVVGFVMPSEVGLADPPAPQDESVRMRRVDAHDAAALRFSGRWTRSNFDRHATRLLEAVSTAGLEVSGPVRYARFDPPWTPWFLRRNEAVVPVVIASRRPESG
jgi:hypothetical protein